MAQAPAPENNIRLLYSLETPSLSKGETNCKGGN